VSFSIVAADGRLGDDAVRSPREADADVVALARRRITLLTIRALASRLAY
jgi:hypothetical protein